MATAFACSCRSSLTTQSSTRPSASGKRRSKLFSGSASRRLGICVVLALAAAAPSAAPANTPVLHFSTFASTDLPLGQVVWSGREFLYNAENDGRIEASDVAGHNFRPFAAFDQGGEEMRCQPNPS